MSSSMALRSLLLRRRIPLLPRQKFPKSPSPSSAPLPHGRSIVVAPPASTASRFMSTTPPPPPPLQQAQAPRSFYPEAEATIRRSELEEIIQDIQNMHSEAKATIRSSEETIQDIKNIHGMLAELSSVRQRQFRYWPLLNTFIGVNLGFAIANLLKR